jgi:hypothetical protein
MKERPRKRMVGCGRTAIALVTEDLESFDAYQGVNPISAGLG